MVCAVWDGVVHVEDGSMHRALPVECPYSGRSAGGGLRLMSIAPLCAVATRFHSLSSLVALVRHSAPTTPLALQVPHRALCSVPDTPTLGLARIAVQIGILYHMDRLL